MANLAFTKLYQLLKAANPKGCGPSVSPSCPSFCPGEDT
jgi:hypothetical protein